MISALMDQYHQWILPSCHYLIEWFNFKVYKKKDKLVYNDRIFNYFGNNIYDSYLFLIKNWKYELVSWCKCYYHYYFVAVYLLEIVQIAKACKLVIGMAQTSIMSVCTNYIKVLYLPIIYVLEINKMAS